MRISRADERVRERGLEMEIYIVGRKGNSHVERDGGRDSENEKIYRDR